MMLRALLALILLIASPAFAEDVAFLPHGGSGILGCTYSNARAGSFSTWSALFSSQTTNDTLTVNGTCTNTSAGGGFSAGVTLNSSPTVSYNGGNGQGIFDIFPAGVTLNGGTVLGPVRVRDGAANFTMENATLAGNCFAWTSGANPTSCLLTGNTGMGNITLLNDTIYAGGDSTGQNHNAYIGADTAGDDGITSITNLTSYDVQKGGWTLKSRPLQGTLTGSFLGCQDTKAQCSQNGALDFPCGQQWTTTHSILERGPHGLAGDVNYYLVKIDEEADSGACPIANTNFQGTLTETPGAWTLTSITNQSGVPYADVRVLGVQVGQTADDHAFAAAFFKAKISAVTATTITLNVAGGSGAAIFDKFSTYSCANCSTPAFVTFTGNVSNGSATITGAALPSGATMASMHAFPGMGIRGTGIPTGAKILTATDPSTIVFTTCYPNACGTASGGTSGETLSLGTYNNQVFDSDIFIFDGTPAGTDKGIVFCNQNDTNFCANINQTFPWTVTVSNSVIVNGSTSTASCTGYGPVLPGENGLCLGAGTVDGGGNRFYASRAAAATGEGWCTTLPVDRFGNSCPAYPYVPPSP